jgi:hypothetical protein
MKLHLSPIGVVVQGDAVEMGSANDDLENVSGASIIAEDGEDCEPRQGSPDQL